MAAFIGSRKRAYIYKDKIRSRRKMERQNRVRGRRQAKA